MNIIGEKVKSSIYGEGTIVKEDDDMISIDFHGAVKQFVFSAFAKSLTAARDEVQAYCLQKAESMRPVPPPPPVSKPENPIPPVHTISNPRRKFYYVFQGKTYEKELREKFIFAPFSPYNRRIHHWERMTEVQEGDIIIHGVAGGIVAVSEAVSRAYKIDMPSWAEWTGDYARRVDVNPCLVKTPLLTSAFTRVIIEACKKSGKYAPFNKRGAGNQGYLFGLPKELAAFFLEQLMRKNVNMADYPFIQDAMWLLKGDQQLWERVQKYLEY